MRTVLTGVDDLLPRRLGRWFAVRVGIYLSVAALAGLTFMVLCGVRGGKDYSAYVTALGALIGVVAALAGFLTLRAVRAPEPAAAVVRYRMCISKKAQSRIDRATAVAMIILLLRTLAAGADPAALAKTISQLRPRRDPPRR